MAGATQQLLTRTPPLEHQPAFDTADQNMVVEETPDAEMLPDPFAEDIGDDQTQLDLEPSLAAAADITPDAAELGEQQPAVQELQQQAELPQSLQHTGTTIKPTATAANEFAGIAVRGNFVAAGAQSAVIIEKQQLDRTVGQAAQQDHQLAGQQQLGQIQQALSPWHQQHQQQQRKAAQRAAAFTAAGISTHELHEQDSEENYYDADDQGDADFDPKCAVGVTPAKRTVVAARGVPHTPPSLNNTPLALEGLQRKLTEFFSPTKQQLQRQEEDAGGPAALAAAVAVGSHSVDDLQQPCQQLQQQQQQSEQQPAKQKQQCLKAQLPRRPSPGQVPLPESVDLTGASSSSEGEQPSAAKPQRQQKPHNSPAVVHGRSCSINNDLAQHVFYNHEHQQGTGLSTPKVKTSLSNSSGNGGSSSGNQDSGNLGVWQQQQQQQQGSIPGIQLQERKKKRSLSMNRRPATSGSQPPQHYMVSHQQQQPHDMLEIAAAAALMLRRQQLQREQQQIGAAASAHHVAASLFTPEQEVVPAEPAAPHPPPPAAAAIQEVMKQHVGPVGQQEQQRKRHFNTGTADVQGKRQRSTSTVGVSAAAAAGSAAAGGVAACSSEAQQHRGLHAEQHESCLPNRFFGISSTTLQAAADTAAWAEQHDASKKGKKAKCKQKKGALVGKHSKESSPDVFNPAAAAATEAVASLAAAAAGVLKLPAGIQLLDKSGLLTWPEMPAGGDWVPATWHTDSTRQLMNRLLLGQGAVSSQETWDSQYATQEQQQQEQQTVFAPARRGNGRGRGSGRKRPAVQHVWQDTCDAAYSPTPAAASDGAAALAATAAGSQASDSIADDLGLEMCDDEQFEEWVRAPCQAMYYVFRDDQGPFFRPFKAEYQALFGDPDRRGRQTAEQVLLAQAGPCHPCNWCPLGSHVPDEHMPAQAQLELLCQQQQQSCAPDHAAAPVLQQRQNLARMLLAAVDLPAKTFLGTYMPRNDALVLHSENNAVTTADLTYVAAVEAYELECGWTEMDGDRIEMLASPQSCLLSLINDSTCWQRDMEELGRSCPRQASGSCTCQQYSGRQPNVVLLHCVYKARDDTAVPAPMFFTSRPVVQYQELLCWYEYLQGHSAGRQGGEPTYWPVQIANSQQLETLQLRLLGAQLGLQHMLQQVQHFLPRRVAQLQDALLPVTTAAATAAADSTAALVSGRAAMAAASAGQLQDEVRHLQASLAVALQTSRREARIKVQSYVDAVLGGPAAGREDEQACSAAAGAAQPGRRRTRSMAESRAEQQKTHQELQARREQRKLVRSNPVKAVRDAVTMMNAEQHVRLCRELLPGFWHGVFKTLDRQLQQQEEQEQQARQGMKQLEEQLLQLQQQLTLYEQWKQAGTGAAAAQQARPAAADDHRQHIDGEAKSRQQPCQQDGDMEGVSMDIEPAADLTISVTATATPAGTVGPVAGGTSSLRSSTPLTITPAEFEAVRQEQQRQAAEQQRQAAVLKVMQQQLEALHAAQ